MAAWRLVGAVGGQDEDRQLGQRAREPCEHVERRLVGAVQVVEEDDERCRLGGGPQRTAHRLDQGAGIRVGGRRAELGQHERQLRAQGSARVDAPGPLA